MSEKNSPLTREEFLHILDNLPLESLAQILDRIAERSQYNEVIHAGS